MMRAKPHHFLAILSLVLGGVGLWLALLPIQPAHAHATASFGPKPGTVVLHRGANSVSLSITPNAAGQWNTITATLSRSGRPIANAAVSLSFAMPAMAMGAGRFHMTQVQRGVYQFEGPGMVMSGTWKLQLNVVPQDGRPFVAGVRDKVAPPRR